jgi:hypothetical protein
MITANNNNIGCINPIVLGTPSMPITVKTKKNRGA